MHGKAVLEVELELELMSLPPPLFAPTGYQSQETLPLRTHPHICYGKFKRQGGGGGGGVNSRSYFLLEFIPANR
jgi:hypothetical protein